MTLLYIGFGVGLAIVAGYTIGLLKLEKWVEPFVWELQKSRQELSLDNDVESDYLTWNARFQQGWFQSSQIVQSVWLYVVLSENWSYSSYTICFGKSMREI